jgi:hypothetical protein
MTAWMLPGENMIFGMGHETHDIAGFICEASDVEDGAVGVGGI